MKVLNEITYLSQRDERWSKTQINDCLSTVGRTGCTITCLSMLTDYYDCYLPPDVIAQNTKWIRGGNVWWIYLDFPTFSFRWREGNPYQSVPVDMDMIRAYMKNPDKAVLLEVANHSHWVVACWETFDEDILVIDPWTGRSCDVLKTYGNITGAALFVKGKATTRLKPIAPDYD